MKLDGKHGPIDKYIEHLRTFGGRGRGASEHTLRAYEGDLGLFVAHIRSVRGATAGNVTDFDHEMVESFIAWMGGQGLSRATMARRQTTLTSFAKWGIRKRYWRDDPLLDVETITAPSRLPRPFSPAERDALLGLPLMDAERALRALLYYAGPRDAEVCGIRLDDLRGPSIREDGSVRAATVRLYGKGGKYREVPLHDECWRPIEEYVALRPKDDRTPDAYLFTHRLGDAWTPRMIRARVKAWGKAAGVPDCTPHRFRHTFGTDTLDATDGDLRTVQELMGHANIATTAGYTKVADRRKEAAVRKLPGRAVIAPSYPSGAEDPGPPVTAPAKTEGERADA